MLQVETLRKAVKLGGNAKKSKRNSSSNVRPDVRCSSIVSLHVIARGNSLCICNAY